MEQDNEKNFTFFRFEDLRIYHKALDYIDWVAHSSENFTELNSVLINKFNNSAYAIALNIAEGSARNKSQFIYYLKMAKSAVRECMVLTTISFNQGLLAESLEKESRGQLMEMTKMLGALISSLQRSVSGVRDSYDDRNAVEEKMDMNNSY